MVLTAVSTEKIAGKITHVHIGYDEDHGVDIASGILSFEYWRNHEAKRANVAKAANSMSIMQEHSNFGWRLRFVTDCWVAFFATDVSNQAGNQYALVPDGDSNKIEYFKVIVPIEDQEGNSKTRTYEVHGGFCLTNRAYIGDSEDGVFEYEGDAAYIDYSDT